MLGVEDESILVDFEEAEKSNPSPRKIIGDRVIYSSRNLGIPKVHGRPILSDFGEARFISRTGTQWEDVQPFIYRAPEVLLRLPWDEKIDIWNLGVLVCIPYIVGCGITNTDTSYRPGIFSNRDTYSTLAIPIKRRRTVITSLR